jgi:hypothetical protein
VGVAAVAKAEQFHVGVVVTDDGADIGVAAVESGGDVPDPGPVLAGVGD